MGLAVVCTIELASRSADTLGPLSQASILSSIAFSAALILGAPFLLVFILGVCFHILWRGRVPIINRIWWPARAAKFDVCPRHTSEIPIPTDWLIKKISIAQAEADNQSIRDDPFGFMNREWGALKAEIKPGDELWSFVSPKDSWQRLAGRMGVALIRDSKVIKAIFTCIN
jgi:hypothetical protein